MKPKHSIPHAIAQRMFLAFERSFTVFTHLTREAKTAFEQNDWENLNDISDQRFDVYEDNLRDAVALCTKALNSDTCGLNFWSELKTEYQKLLPHHPQFELAETFYNSVVGRVSQHTLLNNDDMFMHSTRCHLPGYRRQQILHQIAPLDSPLETIQQLHEVFYWDAPFVNLSRDTKRIISAFKRSMGVKKWSKIYSIDVLRSVFYRNRQAFIVGRVCHEHNTTPFVLALCKRDDGAIFLDAVLLNKRYISALFGFARSSFLVDTPCPAETVWFLRTILNNKPAHELYSALGYYKHGKTEFFRSFNEHINQSREQFELTPGIPGLVMAVFHLPSYPVVFKLIRDEFPESKPFDRSHVESRYRLIKRHDKVGRMADTSEYINFQLPLDRVSEAVLNELKETCSNQLLIVGNTLTIKHLYIERKMTPLNLYLQQPHSPQTLREIIDDLGATIKDIGRAKLFPGDMLQKNFGVTRHYRVIFYDYDEITSLNDRYFRPLPDMSDPFAADALSVGPEDVFPEQFKHFIVTHPDHKALLQAMHPEIFDYQFWRRLQKESKQGAISHVLPYPGSIRYPQD